VLAGAHRAVGVKNAITHTELRLTATGPKIVEINARLGGDMIPFVGWTASGINPGQVAVEVACGQTATVLHSWGDVAAIRFFYPPHDANVVSLELACCHLDGLLEQGVEVHPGQGVLAELGKRGLLARAVSHLRYSASPMGSP